MGSSECKKCSAPTTVHRVFEHDFVLYEARRCCNSFCGGDEIVTIGELEWDLDIVVGEEIHVAA